MKIPVQETIAELEQRIAALEARLGRTAVTATTTTRLTPSQEGHLGAMWAHFDAAINAMRKAFQ